MRTAPRESSRTSRTGRPSLRSLSSLCLTSSRPSRPRWSSSGTRRPTLKVSPPPPPPSSSDSPAFSSARDTDTLESDCTDAAHSLNTLSYCTPFRVTPTNLTDPAIPKPFSWTHEEFKSWVAKESKKIDPDRAFYCILFLSSADLLDRPCALKTDSSPLFDLEPGLAPNGETGLMMTALTEKEFIDRCLGAVRLGQTLASKGAKAFYLHLWKTTCTFLSPTLVCNA